MVLGDRHRENPDQADGAEGEDEALPPRRRQRQGSTPPREEDRESGSSNSGGDSLGPADLHVAVGLPWYLMLHGRDHARHPQSQSGGQARAPQPPQLPGFGFPLVIGLK